MHQDALGSLYDEVVEQIRDHLRRGDTVADAQENHARFCSDMIAAVPSMEDVGPFLKDLTLAFADKFRFNGDELLESLLDGTDAGQLQTIRAASAVTVATSAIPAWKHIVAIDPEGAVTIVALSYRLFAEKKLKKLLTAEKALAKLVKQSSTIKQEESV